VAVPVSQLTDWMYIRDDKCHGGYTIRALVPFMTHNEAAAMRKRLRRSDVCGGPGAPCRTRRLSSAAQCL
jgi:hypothetical protein